MDAGAPPGSGLQGHSHFNRVTGLAACGVRTRLPVPSVEPVERFDIKQQPGFSAAADLFLDLVRLFPVRGRVRVATVGATFAGLQNFIFPGMSSDAGVPTNLCCSNTVLNDGMYWHSGFPRFARRIRSHLYFRQSGLDRTAPERCPGCRSPLAVHPGSAGSSRDGNGRRLQHGVTLNRRGQSAYQLRCRERDGDALQCLSRRYPVAGDSRPAGSSMRRGCPRA